MADIDKPAESFRQALATAIKDGAEGAEVCDCSVCAYGGKLRTPALETLSNEVPRALKAGVPIEDIAAIAAGAFGQVIALALNAIEPDEGERREDAKKALAVFAKELFGHAGLGDATLLARFSMSDEDDDTRPPGATQH